MGKNSFGGIDRGNPPPEVLLEEARLCKLLGEETSNGVEVDLSSPPRSSSIIASPPRARSRARLDYTPPLALQSQVPGFVLEFEIVDSSITSYNICLSIGSDVHFEPKDVMEFVLTLNGQRYPVLYTGGAFHFAESGIRGISFLRRTEGDYK